MMELTKFMKKAAGLAEICMCSNEDAIRYLALKENTRGIDMQTESLITGLPVELIERLNGAMLYHVFLV